jgi:branched-subunit amino acid ABC-type transport system permease component
VDLFWQLLADGVILGSSYALVGVAFGLILQVTGRFHLAFSVTYALAGYMAAEATTSRGAPWFMGLIFGALVAALVGVLFELLVYWPIAERAGSLGLLAVFTAALGLSAAGAGAMNLIWIDSASLQISGFKISAIFLGPVVITNLDVVNVITCWILVLVVWLMVMRTSLGRMIRAVRSNMLLSTAIGISPKLIYLTVFGIGSALGAVGAVFVGTKGAVTVDMGGNSILLALTIVFLAGEFASPLRVGIVGLGLGLVESLSALWFEPSWAPVIVFSILLAYALLKPYRIPRIRIRRRSRVVTS